MSAQTRLTTHGTCHLDEADKSGCTRMPSSMRDHFNVQWTLVTFIRRLLFLTTQSSFERIKPDFLILADAEVALERRDTGPGETCTVPCESALEVAPGVGTANYTNRVVAFHQTFSSIQLHLNSKQDDGKKRPKKGAVYVREQRRYDWFCGKLLSCWTMPSETPCIFYQDEA